MMGPNTTTGHLSVIYSTECQVNFSLRVLKPILQGPSLLSLSPKPSSVAVTLAAEQSDNTWIQRLSKNLVWASGCTSWYIDTKTGRNTMLYPDWQFNFWLRSIFVPVKRDFVYKQSAKEVVPAQKSGKTRRRQGSQLLWNSAVVASVVGAVGLGAGIGRGDIKVDEVDELVKRVPSELKGVSEEVLRFLTFKV